jgi:uncharacterized protein (TIGR00255 family)
MTGYATAEGSAPPFAWSWELRAVNAKGLDLRLRVPDWVDGLEPALRKRLSAALGRGSVTLNLRLARTGSDAGLTLNAAALDSMLAAIAAVEARAAAQGRALAPVSATDVLALRGVLDTGDTNLDAEETAALRARLLDSFEPVLDAFLAARAREGEGLEAALARDLEALEANLRAAAEAADARRPQARAALEAALARLVETTDAVSPERLAQELALLAVKSDVTEEIDRLGLHIAAAREMLAADAPVGRRFDFLMQEFNREANTLCAKSGDGALTAIGLEMKTLIDQMREQVQNVE